MKLNFKNLMSVIDSYIRESKRLNQVNFICNLFGYFVEKNEDFFFDNGRVCRWLKGTAAVSPKIVRFYARSTSNFNKLVLDVREFLLPCLYDKDMAARELYTLVADDETLSQQKRSELLINYPCEEKFIADLIIFALERRFKA
ncbi:MAG: hypothetical protein IJS61_02605, partial [Firmicutes bacterium]|nr:hypothetical protein [Bacillota bacterium]